MTTPEKFRKFRNEILGCEAQSWITNTTESMRTNTCRESNSEKIGTPKDIISCIRLCEQTKRLHDT
jgi:hypothetical protein